MKVKIEIIYRVTTEMEVKPENYQEDVKDGWALASAVWRDHSNADGESVYFDVFEPAMQDKGLDGEYYKVQLIDDDGTLVREEVARGSGDAVLPTL